MSFKRSGYSQTTAQNLLIDAATIYSDVSYTEGTGFTGTLLGATSGGVSVKIEPTYRKPEIDGTYHMDVKGLEILESITGSITAKMKEFTAVLIQRAIHGQIEEATALEAPAGYKKITSRRDVDNSSYIPNIAVVGRLSTGKQVIVIMDNVLCTSPLDLSTEDKNEAVVEQVYKAHATFDQLDADTYPWRIFYPEVI